MRGMVNFATRHVGVTCQSETPLTSCFFYRGFFGSENQVLTGLAGSPSPREAEKGPETTPNWFRTNLGSFGAIFVKKSKTAQIARYRPLKVARVGVFNGAGGVVEPERGRKSAGNQPRLFLGQLGAIWGDFGQKLENR